MTQSAAERNFGLATEFWEFDDARLEVVHTGEGPEKPPIVLVHGLCHGAWCWANFIPRLAELDHEVAALSLRGHGGSSGRDRLHRWGLADYVADVHRVVTRLGRPAVLIGHSMGGAIVQRYVAQHRENVAGAVLFASATAGGLGGARMADVLRGVKPSSLANSLACVVGRRLSADRTNNTPFFGNRLSLDDAARVSVRLGPESLRAVNDLVRHFAEIPSDLPPMLVIGSRDDDLFGATSTGRTATAYRAQPVLLDGLCHDLMLDPEWERALEPVAKFLAQLT